MAEKFEGNPRLALHRRALYLGPIAISWGWKWAFKFKLGHSHSSYRLCVLGVMIEVVL